MVNKSSQNWKYTFLYGLLMLALVALCVWQGMLVHQGLTPAQAMTLRQEKVVTNLPARPGSLYLRSRDRYVLAAVSEQSPYAFADPKMVQGEAMANTAITAAKPIGVGELDLQNLLINRSDSRFVFLKKDLSRQQAQEVAGLRLPGVGVGYDWRRYYPNGELASSVLGFCQKNGLPAGGAELSLHHYMAAVDGVRVGQADACRREIDVIASESQAPVDGNHVFLTLDANIQQFLQDAMAKSIEKYNPKWINGIVVDVNTGEVLAMATAPAFDPNDYNRAPAENRTNRCISLPYEPGSALKPVYAAAAVDRNVLSWQSKIDCCGGLYLAPGGGKISDHGSHYGVMSLIDVVVHSSNIGMAKVGEKLGLKAERDIAVTFGFGKQTGIELPGESIGILRYLKRMDGYSLRRVPFGQEISTTSIQLAMAFAALSNGGKLLKPRIIDHVCDSGGNIVHVGRPQFVRQVIRPQTSAETVAVMQEVVERGTGKPCRSDKWLIGGKTGTAQIPGPIGYIDGAFTGSFIAVAPCSKPRIVVLMSVFWPKSKQHYGAQVAAPYVKEVVEQTLSYLNVPPDRPQGEARSSGPSATHGGTD